MIKKEKKENKLAYIKTCIKVEFCTFSASVFNGNEKLDLLLLLLLTVSHSNAALITSSAAEHYRPLHPRPPHKRSPLPPFVFGGRSRFEQIGWNSVWSSGSSLAQQSFSLRPALSFPGLRVSPSKPNTGPTLCHETERMKVNYSEGNAIIRSISWVFLL